MRYVFIEVYVNSFDGSVLHGFPRDCIWKWVVILFLSSFFLRLILDSLTLVLVVGDRLRDYVREVVVEFAYFQAGVLIEGNLWLPAAELSTLLVFAICLISKVVAVRGLTKFKIIGTRFHIRFPLAQIKIKYMIDMRTNGDFIPCIVAIERVYIPLYHRVVDFLALVELPTIHAFLQLARIKAILIIFFLSSSFISFFFGSTFGISVALRGIFLVLLEFVLGLLILVHRFKPLCFSALLHILKFLLHNVLVWLVLELCLRGKAQRFFWFINFELSIHYFLYAFEVDFIYFLLVLNRYLIIFFIKLPNIWELLRHYHPWATYSFNSWYSIHVRIQFRAICNIVYRNALRHILESLVLTVPRLRILDGGPLVSPSCYSWQRLLRPVTRFATAQWFITHSFCSQFATMLFVVSEFDWQLAHYLDPVVAAIKFERAATFWQLIIFFSSFKLLVTFSWSWRLVLEHQGAMWLISIINLLWTVKNYVFSYFHFN